MKLNRVSHIPVSQRVSRYSYQMLQAKLSTPVQPIRGYNLQPYYTRELQWTTELSDSLSRLYRFSSDLAKVAREFDANADPDQLLQQTHVLVHHYNRLQQFLAEKSDTLITDQLDSFVGVAKASEVELHSFGIQLSSDGQLAVDEQKWTEAVQTRNQDFTSTMERVSHSFRKEALQVQSKPFGSFSRFYEEAMARHPYIASSPSSLHYHYATKTGLYVNERW